MYVSGIGLCICENNHLRDHENHTHRHRRHRQSTYVQPLRMYVRTYVPASLPLLPPTYNTLLGPLRRYFTPTSPNFTLTYVLHSYFTPYFTPSKSTCSYVFHPLSGYFTPTYFTPYIRTSLLLHPRTYELHSNFTPHFTLLHPPTYVLHSYFKP